MRLIPAPGSQEMQRAISRSYVQTIADILLQIIGQDLFKAVALFLQHNDQATLPGFTEKLQALRISKHGRPDAEGGFVTPLYVDELIESIKVLYEQNQNRIGFERGAIVELFATKLVDTRCGRGECQNNHRFVDGRYESDQVDVAVLSEGRRQIEGYACKIKHTGIMSEDCTNLTTLANKAYDLGYEVRIGVVSFVPSDLIAQKIKDRLKDIPFTKPFNVFGIDNMRDLGKSPF